MRSIGLRLMGLEAELLIDGAVTIPAAVVTDGDLSPLRF
jgi:hypothetical protein